MDWVCGLSLVDRVGGDRLFDLSRMPLVVVENRP